MTYLCRIPAQVSIMKQNSSRVAYKLDILLDGLRGVRWTQQCR